MVCEAAAAVTFEMVAVVGAGVVVKVGRTSKRFITNPIRGYYTGFINAQRKVTLHKPWAQLTPKQPSKFYPKWASPG